MILQNYIKNIIFFFYILKCVRRQKKFIKKTILTDIEEVKLRNDQSLSEKDFKKITSYYGIAVPVFGEMICLLRGKKITQSERVSLTYLSGLTGLFDDFFDEKGTPETHILELIVNPTMELSKNTHEQLFVQFYLKALRNTNTNLIKEYFLKVNSAQILSKKQTDPNISTEEIINISKEKGGISVLFYRAALENKMSESEKDMLFAVGYLMQMENDIFDTYKDYQEGVFTLATVEKSVWKLRSEYISILKEINSLIEKTNFQKQDKKNFLRFIAILASRGFVCLDQFAKLEENGIFEVSKYNRKELICDMEKIGNIISWLNYYMNWNNVLR